MKTLNKSSKNKKPTLILLYGAIGVGKLTVARELHKQTGFLLSHNHLIINFIDPLFPRGETTIFRSELFQKTFYLLLKFVAQSGKDIIITHAHAATFTHKNGVSDPAFIKKLCTTFEKAGGIAYPVHLVCDSEVNLERATDKSRKVHGKLIDKKLLKEIIAKHDNFTSAKVKNNFKIDTTKLTAKQTVKLIKEHFNI